LNQIFGQVHRIRIGPDYSMKILDWIRIAKISNLFNTIRHCQMFEKEVTTVAVDCIALNY